MANQWPMLQNENQKESDHSKSVANAANGKMKMKMENEKESDHSKSVGNATNGK